MRRLSIVALSCTTGCFLSSLLPDTRTPTARAREMVPHCSAFSEDMVQPLIAPSLVESVEPAYAYVPSGSSDRELRLRGARIHLRPVATVSRETLQRGLECHQARVVLGDAAESGQDPYVLPGAWLHISADSDGDGFAVDVRSDALPEAKGVLQRARRFVALNR